MKKTKIIFLGTLVLCIISFMPVVAAKPNVRLISDFTDTNNNIAAWADPESGLTLFPHGWYIFGFPEALESIADCNPSGSVLEKELKDGSIMYKVDLHVKGAMMVVASALGVLIIGEMDYYFQTKIIVYDGELSDPVPNLLEIWFPETFPWGDPLIDPIGEGTLSHLIGKGTGTFLDPAMALYYGFDPDEEVKVKVNELGILNKDFEEGHPNYYPDLEQFWPVEMVFFH